jgi:hypothetical protein
VTGTIAIRRIRLPDYLGMHEAFAELSDHALEANPHMAPAAVEAATLLIHPDHIVILGAWRNETLGQDRLAGIWALRRRRDLRTGFAAALCAPLLPLYEVLSTPVLDRDVADAAMQALLRHCIAAGDLPKTLLLPLMPLEGQSFEALAEACRVTRSRLALVERWQRPVMVPRPGDGPETYLRRSLGPSYKKRMQQFRMVQRAGRAGFRRERGAAAAASLDTFLALEAAGWKGAGGTAIAKLPRAAAYFRRLADLFAARDGLLIDSLVLDGTPIAMGLLLESAGRRHFLKIAYDETRRSLSPGRALTIAMLISDFSGTPPRFLDSGAGDGVDAGTYVWGERREMGHAVIALGRDRATLPQLAAEARALLRRLRDRHAKRKARHVG